MRPEKNVVLVRLHNPTLGIVSPPLGIGYLLKVLREINGIRPVFLDCHLHNVDKEYFIQHCKELAPVLLGFQVFSTDYMRFSKLLPLLRKELPDTIIVAGGPHVTALPEETLNSNPELDFVVCSEGEVALPMLVQAILDGTINSIASQIPNLVYRKDGSCIRNKIEFVDVDKYGSPAWDLLEPQHYPPIQHGTFHKSTKVVPIITSRGCPYPCTFCAGSLMTGKVIRRRNINDVVDEIEFLINTYGFEEFIIEDENFTFYKEHVLNFAAEIQKRGIKCYFSFPNGVRIDRLDEDIVRSLRGMGTYMMALGIESISPNTLKRMKKQWTRDQIFEKVQLLKKYGIIVQASFILGFRDDTLDDMQESTDFSLELDIDQAYFGNYVPLPGTEDFNILIEKREIILSNIDWNNYNAFYGQYPYHPKEVTVKQLEHTVKKATIQFYLRPRILFTFLHRISSLTFAKSIIFRVSRVFLKSKGK